MKDSKNTRKDTVSSDALVLWYKTYENKRTYF